MDRGAATDAGGIEVAALYSVGSGLWRWRTPGNSPGVDSSVRRGVGFDRRAEEVKLSAFRESLVTTPSASRRRLFFSGPMLGLTSCRRAADMSRSVEGRNCEDSLSGGQQTRPAGE